ncbi:MAG: hypothetical protein IJO71_01980 [Microbacterium sp.]|uniref:hypothetical protein n=1 Tax=Microbacterium sp. TaxID=51671 RepID=UPI0025F8480F|nr:hypothetical protein [Microbacterium sp.]MBQ9915950.1 hypothetical protein [Microbacterium sp.]
MAKIELKDGSLIPVVQPNLFDTAEIEQETSWNRKEYARMMKTTSIQTAAAVFASMRRAGHKVTFTQCAELDGIKRLIAQPGDLAAAEQESEGEESSDPQ